MKAEGCCRGSETALAWDHRARVLNALLWRGTFGRARGYIKGLNYCAFRGRGGGRCWGGGGLHELRGGMYTRCLFGGAVMRATWGPVRLGLCRGWSFTVTSTSRYCPSTGHFLASPVLILLHSFVTHGNLPFTTLPSSQYTRDQICSHGDHASSWYANHVYGKLSSSGLTKSNRNKTRQRPGRGDAHILDS